MRGLTKAEYLALMEVLNDSAHSCDEGCAYTDSRFSFASEFEKLEARGLIASEECRFDTGEVHANITGPGRTAIRIHQALAWTVVAA